MRRKRPGLGGVDGIGRLDVGEVRPLTVAVRREEGRDRSSRRGSIHQGTRSRGETRSARQQRRPGSAGRHNNTCRNRYKDMK